MRRRHAVAALCLLAGLALLVPALADGPAKPKSKNPHLGKLRHVVLLQFKEGTTPEEIAKLQTAFRALPSKIPQVVELETAFRALPSKIPQVVELEWGRNNSTENLSEGLTHCFLLTFEDTKGRDAYLPHAAHQEFVALLRPRLEKVVVVDYVVKE